MNRFGHLPLIAALAISITTGCGERRSAESDAPSLPARVVAVNEPLRYFAQRIGSELVDAVCPCPAGVSPADWQPTAEQLKVFHSADLVLLNGGDYAKWTLTTSLPDSRIVNTGRAFREQWLSIPEAVRHRHGPEGEHSHQATIGEFWLDPQLAAQQARRIAAALKSRYPRHAADFERGLRELEQELEQHHQQMVELLDLPLFTAEPAFEYVARAVNRPIHRFTWPNLDALTKEEIAELEGAVSEEKGMFLVSSSPSRSLDDALQRVGLEAIVYDIGAATEGTDFAGRMHENLRRLQQ